MTQPGAGLLVRYAAPVAVLLALVVVIAGCQTPPAPTAVPTPEAITQAALEDRYGVLIRLLAVTGAGGLVDLRFKVLDAEKAGTLLKDSGREPILVIEDSGVTLKTGQGLPDDLTLQEGVMYFVVYPNAGGAVRTGTAVTVVFGDVRIEPILAK